MLYRILLVSVCLSPLLGCGSSTAPATAATNSSSPASRKDVAQNTTPATKKADTSDDWTPPPYPDFANMGKDAEPLPPVPQADPKSTLQALQPDKSIFLETKPDGSRRVLLQSEVCMIRGPLEVLLCKTNTKEHEAILRTSVPPQFIDAALLAAGAEKGSPVQFVNPMTGEEAYRPASGDKIRVSVNYRKGGTIHTRPAQEWIRDIRTDKPMTHEWVFAGSRFIKNPERPEDPPFYTANNGEIIGISNFPDSTLDLPVPVSQDNSALSFEARTVELPPLLSKVWVILEPEPRKKSDVKPNEKPASPTPPAGS